MSDTEDLDFFMRTVWTATRRGPFRCRKGHVVPEMQQVGCGSSGRTVIFCAECYLDLIERECGGLQEVTDA